MMDEKTAKTDIAEKAAKATAETAEKTLRTEEKIASQEGTDIPPQAEKAEKAEKQPLSEADRQYRLQEERAIVAEQQRQQRTAQQSAGSMYTGEGQSAPASAAFARAFTEALQ